MDRYHNFELILYYKPTIFNSIINEDKNILHYAYILHDKDSKDEDGALKVEHFHLLINYKNAKTFNACKTQFTIPSYNTLVIPIKDKQKQERFEYLTHLNNPEKFQYAKELIVTDSSNFWLNVENNNTEKTVNLINDLISNRPLRELMEIYGRDFVINYDKYKRFAIELTYIENKDYLIHKDTGEIVAEQVGSFLLDDIEKK